MALDIKLPQISKKIYTEDTLNVLTDNYQSIAPIWSSHQLEWMCNIYHSFKDHDKFMILIHLISKTLDFYSKNFVKLTYDEFYSKEKVEIESFNISQLSKDLNMPKESARRKILELENALVIKREKKKIIVDRSSFSHIKPINSVKRISRYLSTFSNFMYNEKILEKKLTSQQLEKTIIDNFTYVWKNYYEVQIPMLLSYKKFFKDLETFHIWGTCANNSFQHSKKSNIKKMKLETIDALSDNKTQGINAMSIADITGIPRATVVRKLKKLVKLKYLTINEKKHYKLSKNIAKKIIPLQDSVLKKLAIFSTTIYNLTIFSS
jgi:DNA-binding Lrp family transcriptional regulator